MMSSETSSNAKRKRRAAAPPAGRMTGGRAVRAGQGGAAARDAGADAPVSLNLQPMHLLILGIVAAASAAALLAHGTRPANIVFVVLAVVAAGIVAIAVFRTLWPLASDVTAAQPEMVGGRTRAALEREKTIVLRAIKELEFDRAMGKVSAADCEEMIGRLRARAVRLLRQLDAGSAGYRELIDRELNARLGSAGLAPRPTNGREGSLAGTASAVRVGAAVTSGDATGHLSGRAAPGDETPMEAPRFPSTPVAPNACLACGSVNDADARFCKTCGTKLGAPA